MLKKFLIALLLGTLLVSSPQIYAQHIVLSAPHGRFAEHWYENIGTSFYLEQNFSRGGWFFNWGAPVYPPFGGYDGRDAMLGVGFRQRNFSGRFRLWASQGNSRSTVMEAPYLSVPHGGYGWILYGTRQPFVTGWTPILGNQPQWQYPLRHFVDSAEFRSLKQTSVGDKDPQQIEHVQQTLSIPRQDPPLTLINGKQPSVTNEQ